jgi:chromosome segregation ATPase
MDELRARYKALDSDYNALQKEWLQADDAIQTARSTIQILTNERDIAFAEKECLREERDGVVVEIRNYQAQMNDMPSAENETELKRWLEVLLHNVTLTPASFSQLHTILI